MKSSRFSILLTFCLLVCLTSCFKWDQYEFPNPINLQHAGDACNGHPELCDRRFDSVAFATTHNSYNYEIGFSQFFAPNQDFDVARQLRDGVRALMLDVYDESGELVVYHGFALTGSEPLSVPLEHLHEFLDSNSREIVSIIFETTVDGNTISNALTDAGLIDYVHTQSTGAPWPTLSNMIESGKRLVIFTENQALAGTPPWFHYAWGNIFDTPYDFGSQADFSCDINRGNSGNALFLVNHWVSLPIVGTGIKDSAAVVNDEGVLWPRVQNCMAQNGHIANFVAVDFYRQGDLFRVVDSINGIVE
jgi:Phosphatidylinositol-specific phospholipase C, X domain